MSDKYHYIFAHDTARRTAAAKCMAAPDGWHCRIEQPTRNLEQSAKMWAMLTDVSDQIDWYGKKLSPEDWKHIFTSSLKKMDVVPNFEGTGFVALGLSTSKMSKKEMSDLIDLISAFGIERGVKFKENQHDH